MATFLSAHGYSPGPTQRPLLAGAIAGVLATVPALGLLYVFPSLAVEARILRRSELMTVVLGWAAMAAAGMVYGRLFGRAANDPRGGWLFGMAFGFALWAAGGVMVLPLLSGGLVPAGEAAIGLLLSLLSWGAALGGVYPHVHRPLHESLESASKKIEIGPSAATARGRRSTRQIMPPRRELGDRLPP